MSNLKDLEIKENYDELKGSCEMEVIDLIFCMGRKYVCYDKMRLLDICLEKNKLEDYKKSLKVPFQ
jgi:hypothetical protein